VFWQITAQHLHKKVYHSCHQKVAFSTAGQFARASPENMESMVANALSKQLPVAEQNSSLQRPTFECKHEKLLLLSRITYNFRCNNCAGSSCYYNPNGIYIGIDPDGKPVLPHVARRFVQPMLYNNIKRAVLITYR
jgi:hypothetical protein